MSKSKSILLASLAAAGLSGVLPFGSFSAVEAGAAGAAGTAVKAGAAVKTGAAVEAGAAVVAVPSVTAAAAVAAAKQPVAKPAKSGVGAYRTADVKAVKQETKDRIVWKAGSITLSAGKQRSAEPGLPASLSEVTAQAGGRSVKLAFDQPPGDIVTASLSPDGSTLAFEVQYGYGSALYLFLVKEGKFTNLNAIVPFRAPAETVSAYNWSPDGRRLALAYGDTGSSRLAIYDAATGSFTNVPRTVNLISTALVLWDTKGTFVDYVSESPSDQYVRYRYAPAAGAVKPVTKVGRDALQELTGLAAEQRGSAYSPSKTELRPDRR
ncbi:TolB family protein [Paenibacillus sp. CN-4]|uniref:TolB family protein n=1 Tax=Paenibacillus nanchangensis TaxID=3348343 RepID=UPI00397CB755